ncbi:MAG: carbohydrate kinase family protein [Ignavibacteriales bacterium]|nr:carbohydrate kinase family protein [Ignavibacteriales bacterium]
MRITLIGHLCRDVVHIPEESGSERITESYGGIFWAVATLANILSVEDTVYPVFGAGDDEHDAVLEKLRLYRNVDVRGIFKFKGPTNQVHLFYDRQGRHRTECSKHISDPIPFPRISPYRDVDGILINMVSGFDITLETMDLIRMAVREEHIPIHFDFHSLTLGVDAEFKRFRRPVTNWRRWCFMVNSLQLSEEEAAGLSTEQFNEQSFVHHALSVMANGLIITRDRRGGTLFRQELKKVMEYHFGGIPTNAVDPTGCGDVFGAAFLAEYVRTRDWNRSADFANQVAAAKTLFSGVEGVDRIPKMLEVRSIA